MSVSVKQSDWWVINCPPSNAQEWSQAHSQNTRPRKEKVYRPKEMVLNLCSWMVKPHLQKEKEIFTMEEVMKCMELMDEADS